MREIKFRAWDKVEKAMRDVVGIDFRDNTVNLTKVFPNGKTGNYWRDLSNVVLMEYLGFKDMYGNEVYEGDILYDYDLGLRLKTSEFNKFGIGWIKNEFADHKFEVMGNIFKDPELASGL